jgi:hypothetical protein
MVCEYDPAVRDYCLERILNTSRSRNISLKLSGGHIVVICLINLACREIGCFGDDKPGSNDEQNTKSGEYKKSMLQQILKHGRKSVCNVSYM